MDKWHGIAITAGIAVSISVILSVGIVRLCIGSNISFPLSIRSIACGNNLNAERVGFKRLGKENLFITSGTYESKEYSIDKGTDAAKLIDGDERTLAAPGNRRLDYILTLTEPYQISKTIIIWGDYGTISKYVTHWKLEAKRDDNEWTTIEEGNLPKSRETIVKGNYNASAVRLTAESPEDWIGAYELELVGRPL